MRNYPTKVDVVSESSLEKKTYYAVADAVAFVQNKSHMSIVNAVDSGKKVLIHAINPINNSLTAVTGVGVRFDLNRATGHSSGTDITVYKNDTTNPALSGITVKTGATITGETLVLPMTMSNDENPLTGVSAENGLRSALNYLPQRDGTQPLTLRPGEGLSIKQITNSVVGSFAWLIVFTVEDV